MNDTSRDQLMPPDLQSSLLCDDVRQERNGKFILIGIFEGLIVSEFPTVFHRICVVNRWCCGDGEFSQLTRIVSSDGKSKLAEGRPVRLKFPDVNQVATAVEFFVNTRIEAPGTYWVEILLDGQLKLRYPLHVRKHHEAT